MKKVIYLIVVIFLCVGCIKGFFPQDIWSKYEKQAKVNISETFSGNIDDVIDNYIVYREDNDTIYDDELEAKDLAYELGIASHKTFDKYSYDDEITCYIAYSFRGCAFINGYFEDRVGIRYIPSIVKLKKLENNTYKITSFLDDLVLLSCNYSVTQRFYSEIERDYFVNEKKYTKEINKKLDEKAKNYMKKIGRKAKIIDDVDVTELLDYIYTDRDYIDEEKADKLFDMCDEFQKKEYPYWIGNREVLSNNKRYIYKADETRIGKRKYIITYTKTDENGNVLEQYKVNVDKADYEIKKIV